MIDPREVLQLHLVTEKSVKMKEAGNCYVFQVARTANKPQIKEAVEKAFKVKVETIRTMVAPSKPKRLGRFEGRTTAWKKAVVTLKEGEKIAEFENV